jgi:hypothetical protein
VREVTLTCDGSHRVKCWGHKGSDSRKQAGTNQKATEPIGTEKVGLYKVTCWT